MMKLIRKALLGRRLHVMLHMKRLHLSEMNISDNEIVITADTIVWCNNKVLGKPVDHDDAIAILKEISGNTHEVITGVSILSIIKGADLF